MVIQGPLKGKTLNQIDNETWVSKDKGQGSLFERQLKNKIGIPKYEEVRDLLSRLGNRVCPIGVVHKALDCYT